MAVHFLLRQRSGQRRQFHISLKPNEVRQIQVISLAIAEWEGAASNRLFAQTSVYRDVQAVFPRHKGVCARSIGLNKEQIPQRQPACSTGDAPWLDGSAHV